MRRRRILFVTDLDVWLLQEGGPAVRRAGNQSLYNTLRGYARAGWDVEVLTAKDVHGDLGPLEDGIRIRRVEMALQGPVRWLRRARASLARAPAPAPAGASAPRTALDASALDNPGRWAAFQAEVGARALARCLSWRPDVVYGYEIYGAPVAAAAGRLLRIPSVARFQGTLLGAWADDPAGMRRFRTHVAALRAPADLVVMADDGTRGDVVLGRLGVDPGRVRFWANGVVKSDVEAAAARRDAEGARRPGPLRLLTASRLVDWKRVDRVRDLLAALPAGVPPWTLTVAGDGPERAALEALAARRGLADRVDFAGALPHDAVLDRLVRADAYLSLYDLSNLSNGVLEALVAGVPVLALDVGGTSRAVRDGECGVLVRPDRLAEDGPRRLARLLSDGAWRSALADGAARAGRERVEDWGQRMAREVAEVEALAARRRPAGSPGDGA